MDIYLYPTDIQTDMTRFADDINRQTLSVGCFLSKAGELTDQAFTPTTGCPGSGYYAGCYPTSDPQKPVALINAPITVQPTAALADIVVDSGAHHPVADIASAGFDGISFDMECDSKTCLPSYPAAWPWAGQLDFYEKAGPETKKHGLWLSIYSQPSFMRGPDFDDTILKRLETVMSHDPKNRFFIAIYPSNGVHYGQIAPAMEKLKETTIPFSFVIDITGDDDAQTQIDNITTSGTDYTQWSNFKGIVLYQYRTSPTKLPTAKNYQAIENFITIAELKVPEPSTCLLWLPAIWMVAILTGKNRRNSRTR